MKKLFISSGNPGGFSLVEMLMALLVASLLLAALAPVMTRKFAETVNVSGTGEAIIPTGGCIVTEGLQEDFCEIPQNTYSINAIIASGGGGGGGAAKYALGTVRNNASISGTSGGTNYNSKSYNITKNMQNITIQLVGGGGGAGGGWSNEGGYPAKQADCGNWGVYIGPEYSGSTEESSSYHSICVSQRNPEVNGGGAAPKLNVSGVTYVNAGTECTAGWAMCCWVGKTSLDCDSSGGNYSGCNRALCNWNAGYEICRQWMPITTAGASTGRLATHAEINGWGPGMLAGKLNTYHSGYGESSNYPGLQLCNSFGGPGKWSKCGGSNNCAPAEACYTHVIWGSSPSVNVTTSGHMSVNSNNISAVTGLVSDQGGTGYSAHHAFGVRCVIDKISGFTTYRGGGGGAGLYAKVKIPNEVIRKATKNGGTASLKLMAGGGGAGNSVTVSASGSSAMAAAGVSSRAELYDENNNRVWVFQVPGGRPGNSAFKTANGANGIQINLSSNNSDNGCYYLNKYSSNVSARTESRVACNSIPDSGVVLELQAGGAGIAGAGGGGGAKGYFDNSETSSAGSGSAGTRGGGGGGGQCTIGPTRLSPKCTKGGNGGGGMAHFTYQLSTPGAGGGGGGAGAVVHIKNITNGIKPGVKITMRAGAGGAGGNIGNNGGNGTKGNNGESSYISYSTIKYEVFGGGGGGGATAGKPDINQKPKSGIAGAKSSIDTAKLNSLVGSSNYKYYPSDLNKTAGKAVVYKDDFYMAPGGNGGINSKISPYTSLPCGGLSDISIDYYGAKDINPDNLKCNQIVTNNLAPLVLSINEIVKQFKPNMATIMSESNAGNYAGETLPGATGGGGGAWSWPENENEKASNGANGMKGYVIIYWNLQE